MALVLVMSTKRSVLCLVLCVSLMACAAEDVVGTVAGQGIQGVVLLGPQCPVESLDDPCPDIPYQAWIDFRRLNGMPVARVQSGEDGRFRVDLPTGAYILAPESGTPFPIAADLKVAVAEGEFSEVTVNFDTGIR